jgi:adenine-specific DNA-methyltransferase
LTVSSPAKAERDIARFGQIFTPEAIVERMLTLVRNRGRVLEPACGDGAFTALLPPHYPEVVAIEIDAAHCPPGALNADFFTYPEAEKFDTVISNPPFWLLGRACP